MIVRGSHRRYHNKHEEDTGGCMSVEEASAKSEQLTEIDKMQTNKCKNTIITSYNLHQQSKNEIPELS